MPHKMGFVFAFRKTGAATTPTSANPCDDDAAQTRSAIDADGQIFRTCCETFFMLQKVFCAFSTLVPDSHSSPKTSWRILLKPARCSASMRFLLALTASASGCSLRHCINILSAVLKVLGSSLMRSAMLSPRWYARTRMSISDVRFSSSRCISSSVSSYRTDNQWGF